MSKDAGFARFYSTDALPEFLLAREHMPRKQLPDSFRYTDTWCAVAAEYARLTPRFPRLRQPGTNYLQVDAGGKAAHYEWKILQAPRPHIEVALHFEAPTEDDNDRALQRVLEGGDSAIRAGTLTPFRSGRWGGKWTRAAFDVSFSGTPDDEAVSQSVNLMQLLVERTYPRVRDVFEASAQIGWPAD
jgi:hypothetical protein